MANPLGILIANLVSPRIVQSCSDVLYLNIFTAVSDFAYLHAYILVGITKIVGAELIDSTRGFYNYNEVVLSFFRISTLLHSYIILFRSEPPHPPTISASHEYFDFFKGIYKRLLKIFSNY